MLDEFEALGNENCASSRIEIPSPPSSLRASELDAIMQQLILDPHLVQAAINIEGIHRNMTALKLRSPGLHNNCGVVAMICPPISAQFHVYIEILIFI